MKNIENIKMYNKSLPKSFQKSCSIFFDAYHKHPVGSTNPTPSKHIKAAAACSSRPRNIQGNAVSQYANWYLMRLHMYMYM